jgi:hypothetical protein
MSTQEIAKALGRGHAIIKIQADKLGLLSAKRRASAAVRHDYFAAIDEPIKAYILGLFASDGWVSSSRNEVGIALHVKDGALVNLVRDQIAPLSRVNERTDGSRLDFRLSSAQVKADLVALEVTPRKSQTLQWPEKLPDQFQASYILGCFDGDGCLSYDAKLNYYKWSLVSASRAFLEEVRARLRAATGVKIQGPYGRRNGNLALSIQYKGPKIGVIDEWLHADVNGLARKRPRWNA